MFLFLFHFMGSLVLMIDIICCGVMISCDWITSILASFGCINFHIWEYYLNSYKEVLSWKCQVDHAPSLIHQRRCRLKAILSIIHQTFFFLSRSFILIDHPWLFHLFQPKSMFVLQGGYLYHKMSHIILYQCMGWFC